MVGTKFLVQWEEHPSNMATRLGYLLENQILVDVTLMCNTHTLKVHKVVLASCSPYFEGVLQKQLGTHPLIVLKDMKFSVLRSLIEFMYCGETSIAEDNLPALLDAAKFFEVKGLASMNRDSMSGGSTPNGATTSTATTSAPNPPPSAKPGTPLVSNGAPNLGTPNSLSSTSSTLSASSEQPVSGVSTSIAAISSCSKSAPGYPRTRGKISGRGRRSSFINSDPATTMLQASGVSDPASILLSLAKSRGGKLSPLGTGRFSSALSPGKSGPQPPLTNGSLSVAESLSLAQNNESRRPRGRRKLGEALVSPGGGTSSSLAHSIEKSPLLASLLATEQARKKGALVTDPRYAEMLKKTTLVSSSSSTSGGTSTNTGTSEPTIFYTQNNSGDLVSLGGAGSATFLTLEGLGGEGGEVTEAVVMQDGTICTAEGNHIAVDSKFVQSSISTTDGGGGISHPSSSSNSSPLSPHPIRNVLQQVTPPPSDPDAVVLYEMNEESNSVDKYVISSEEVQALRMLNQLMKQKSLTKREISKMITSNDESSNTTVAEIDLMLGGGKGKCKSLIKKILEMGNGLKGTLERLVANQSANNNNNSICSGGDESNSNCSNSIQDSGGDAQPASESQFAPHTISSDEFLIANEASGDNLSIDPEAACQIRLLGSSAEDVLLDSSSNVLIDQSNGNVLIDQSNGNVLIDQSNGNVLIDQSNGNVLIDQSHGNVLIDQSNGNVLIDQSHGNVLMDQSNGNVLIDQSHGNVLIDQSNGNVLIDQSNGNVLMDNSGGGVLLEDQNGEEEEERKVQNEMNVEMDFKIMDEEDGYVTEDKVDDEFKLHNEEDSHSSHSFSSSQNKIILSNVLMNSGEDMNILSHMESVPGHKGLELGDCDDCSSQEDYLKANYSVDDLMKRKSTDEDLTNLPTKRVKYEDYTSSSLNNHHDS